MRPFVEPDQTLRPAKVRHRPRRARPRRARRLVLAALVVVLLATLIAVLALRSGSSEPIWSDEFDGAAGASPDASRWGYDIGGTGWGNNELQRYTDDPENVSLDGAGNLAITVRQDTSGASCLYGTCRFTSARIITSGKFATTYGRLEARIKLPTGKGIWPAFWTQGQDVGQVGWPAAGEIDVMEHLGGDPTNVSGALHAPDYDIQNSYTTPDGASLSEGFHTYAVDWTPQTITWLVDGQAWHSEALDGRGEAGAAFGKPHYLMLNVAVDSVTEPPDATTVLPQTMLVDYVRVYAPAD